MKNFTQRTFTAAAIYFLSIFSTSAQIPGSVIRQASSIAGRTVLDPNGDGFTSATTAGFGGNDVINAEISFNPIKAYSIEPYADLSRGPAHGFSDYVPDSAGNGVYHHFSAAQNILFRMRLGAIIAGSKGFSILMDTDGKFGVSGPNADPNYQAATTGVNGNPGFEIEIVLETNFRIAIYNVDGSSNPTLVKQYTNWQDMSQVSVASSNDNGDPDFLIDFYIPFSDLQAAPFNLTTSSPIRMTATTVMKPGAAIGGPRSDIYGTSGNTYEEFIDAQPACSIFNNPANCSTAMCTAAPVVNSPIGTGTVSISGTWTKGTINGAATVAAITVYKNGTAIGTINNILSGNSWNLPGIALVNGDIITAKAVATGETMCLTSNAVTANTCNAANRPATPVLSCTTGSKGVGGNNLSGGWTVHVDNITRNVNDNNVSNSTGLFGAITGTSPNLTWVFSGGCSSGAPLTSGSYKIYYTDNATGCNSLPAYFCAAGNGGSALAGALAAPTITSPQGSIFTTATRTISGTTDANASVALYINGINVQNTTATGGTFNFNNLNLSAGQQVFIIAELNTGTISTSKCAAQTAIFTVSCFTTIPSVQADNNGQLAAGSPVTGTSGEAAGTVIRVYTAANVLVATTSVQANGSWSTANAGTTPAVYNAVNGTTYYANAQAGSCGISGNSAGYAAITATSAARCGSITGPVGAAATSLSGTVTGSLANTIINIYADNELIASTTTSGTSWGPVAVNTTAGNALYANAVLSIGIQEPSRQEVFCPASAIKIACSPQPASALFTPQNTAILTGQSVTFTISNAIAGSFYAIADSVTGASFGQGQWATATGPLNITAGPFLTAGTYKLLIRSTSLNGVNQCTAASATAIITVTNSVLPLQLISFDAVRQSKNILLNWSTTSETGLLGFDVERSKDAIHYTAIAHVTARNQGSLQRYSLPDGHPLQGNNFYRLRITETDGSFSYSNVVMVKFSEEAANLSAGPNPFSNEINIRYELPNPVRCQVQLLDITGSVIKSISVKGMAGENKFTLSNLNAVPAGTYILKIVTAGMVQQQKVVKVAAR